MYITRSNPILRGYPSNLGPLVFILLNTVGDSVNPPANNIVHSTKCTKVAFAAHSSVAPSDLYTAALRVSGLTAGVGFSKFESTIDSRKSKTNREIARATRKNFIAFKYTHTNTHALNNYCIFFFFFFFRCTN